MKGPIKNEVGWSFSCRALQTLVYSIFSCLTISLISSKLTHAQCSGGTCEHFKFIINEDVTYNHALQGHVFMTATVRSTPKCHLLCRDDCRCISINYFPNEKENNCQLNDANKYQNPTSLKPRQGSHHYDLIRYYTTRSGTKYVPGKNKCVGECCQSSPCLNGGTCKEMCEPEGPRFQCLCRPGMGGKYCQSKLYGCKDVFDVGSTVSGQYVIYDLDNNFIPVFCDLESELNFTWTLIQSYSLANNNNFNTKPMGVDHPVNEESMSWQNYRLSLLHMQYIANTSTHFRATCNFDTDGLAYTDYARTRLDGLGVFDVFTKQCVRYEFLNIRGIECYDCTAGTFQVSGRMLHINSYSSRTVVGCDFDGRSATVVTYEQNFGQYDYQNAAFRCSSAPEATTQFWFGYRKT